MKKDLLDIGWLRTAIRFGAVVLFAVGFLMPATTFATVCKITVTVQNNGNTENGGDVINVEWNGKDSQFQAKGAKHAICGRNLREKCEPETSILAPTGAEGEQTFNPESGGCDIARKVWIQLRNGQQLKTVECNLVETSNDDQSVTIGVVWDAPSFSHSCTSPSP